MLDVNLTGPFLLMKACIPHMIRAEKGSVINVSSLAGLRCNSDMPGYCTTKGGLINLTQQAALDYGRYNVRCNAVCPGLQERRCLQTTCRNSHGCSERRWKTYSLAS